MSARTLVLAVVCVLCARPSDSAKFQNSVIEFDMPDFFSCVLERSTYSCQDTRPERQKESIIVFAAKYRGGSDNLAEYRSYLAHPKTWTTDQGTQVTSKVISVENVVRNGMTWVDAIHDDSEILGFRTHYLATMNNTVAILVTFSIKRSRYTALAPVFELVIRTLKLKG